VEPERRDCGMGVEVRSEVADVVAGCEAALLGRCYSR
jgi:hypothetical protein